MESGVGTLPSPCTPDANIAYTVFCRLRCQSAKKTIPRGCRQQYIPISDDKCDHHYKEFLQAKDKESADAKAADLMDKYLGIKLDRQLTYRQHIEGLRGKVMQEPSLSDACLGQLAVQMLKPFEQPLFQLFTATQSIPLQCGAETPIPKSWTYPWMIPWGSQPTAWNPPPHLLPVLSGIAPAKLRKNYVTNKISHYAWSTPTHLLSVLSGIAPAKLRKNYVTNKISHHA